MAWKDQSSAQLVSVDGDESDTMEVLNDRQTWNPYREEELAIQRAVGSLFQNINNITNVKGKKLSSDQWQYCDGIMAGEENVGDQPDLTDNEDGGKNNHDGEMTDDEDVKSAHDGIAIELSCELCELRTTRRDHLRQHV